MPNHNKPIAFGDDKQAVDLFVTYITLTLGWTAGKSVVEYLPNPYGPIGDLILRSWHFTEEDGTYAGVLTREAYWDKHGTMQTDYEWTPFTVDTFAGY